MKRIAKRTLRHTYTSLPVLVAGIFSTGATIAPCPVQADPFSTYANLYGDFRWRVESDWDSHKPNGVEREDRNRTRIRLRLGMNFNPSEHFSFGVGWRTGQDENPVSPNITILDFDGNDTGNADFFLEKWFFKAKKKGLWGWVGRNDIPFWRQNDLIWAYEVTPAGIGAGYKMAFGASELALNSGYFSLPAGMHKFSGNLGVGQVVFSTKFGATKLTAAGGLLALEANPDGDKDAEHSSLWDGNGGRDYSIWVGNLQAKFNVGNLPLTLGLDVMHNAKDYSATHKDSVGSDPYFTAKNRDETDGYIFSVKLGQLKETGDWLLGYYNAHIETLALNSSYTQDSLGRWKEQGTNMKAHEFRMAYKPLNNLSIVARLYLVEAITSDQDGNRFRVDFNSKF